MPSPKRSPNKSPKRSPKKGGRSSPGRGGRANADELAELDRKYFGRKRYDTMAAVFTQKSPVLSIYARSIHIYETWNKIPTYEQFCNSNMQESNESNKKKSPKSKTSPKRGGAQKKSQDEPPKPELEPAILTGIVAVHKSHLQKGKKLFAEITATFQYVGHSKVPPFPDNVMTVCQCFRDVMLVYPLDFDTTVEISEFNQQLISKLKNSMQRGYRFFPFYFDVTRKPDSVFFTRPYYNEYSSGLMWNMRAYLAEEENCKALPDQEISMEFFKYTITPVIIPTSPRETPAVEYTRISTMDDTGDLVLWAQLERDVYYQGQEIKVKIKIENNSSRHVVNYVAVFAEQTYKLFHQFPHDSSIPLGEVILHSGEGGLPVQPKNRNWTREVVIKATYDPTKYNLAIDGKMSSDNKIFLANSTVIMRRDKIVETKLEKPDSRPPSPKGSPKGKKASPKKSKSPKRGKSPPSKKGTKSSPPVDENISKPGEEPRVVTTITEINTLTDKQVCRSVAVAYDVVVRINLRTPSGDESGNPMVRLPFILTRETQYLDKLANPPPPTWAVVKPH